LGAITRPTYTRRRTLTYATYRTIHRDAVRSSVGKQCLPDARIPTGMVQVVSTARNPRSLDRREIFWPPGDRSTGTGSSFSWRLCLGNLRHVVLSLILIARNGGFMAQVPITAIWLYSHRVPICPPELRSSDMSNHPTWIADATVVCVPEEAPHCTGGTKRS
jgi:hypothetical protein